MVENLRMKIEHLNGGRNNNARSWKAENEILADAKEHYEIRALNFELEEARSTIQTLKCDYDAMLRLNVLLERTQITIRKNAEDSLREKSKSRKGLKQRMMSSIKKSLL